MERFQKLETVWTASAVLNKLSKVLCILAKLLSKVLCKTTEYAETAKQAWKDCKAWNSLTSISFAEQAEKGAKYDGQTTEYAELGWDS